MCWGGLGNERRGEGVRAVGGHLEGSVTAAVISLGTLLMYRLPYNHHGLRLQVIKLINKNKNKKESGGTAYGI